MKGEDARAPRGGWAPGGYIRTCKACQIRFTGDKRAWTCADCAYAEASSPGAPPMTADLTMSMFANKEELRKAREEAMTTDLLSDEIARLIEPIAWTALGMMDAPVYENRRAASLEKAARILRLAEARIVERCAKVAEDYQTTTAFPSILAVAIAIRIRSLPPLAKETK